MTYPLNARIIFGDVRQTISTLQKESVRTCITAPPHWDLKDHEEDNQLGQEDDPDKYVQALVGVFRGVREALTGDGTLWLNLGDSYVGTGRKTVNNTGLKTKDMIGLPWRVAFALQADGWYLRSDIIWNKPNVVSSAVKDRPVSSYEHIFLFSKSPKYFYDQEAVKEDTVDKKGKRTRRDVWNVNVKPYKGTRLAVYPKELILPCVLAGSEVGDTVLDPFSGSGTTGVVSLENERNYIGLEPNLEHVELSRKRIIKEVNKSLLLLDDLQN
jgi:site-specific DNA-methyltransferase (cytosine-N4-specific)